MTTAALRGVVWACASMTACAQPAELRIEVDPLQSAVTHYLAIGAQGVTYLEYDRYRLTVVRAGRSPRSADWDSVLRRAAAAPPSSPDAAAPTVEDDIFRMVYCAGVTPRVWTGHVSGAPTELRPLIGEALVLAGRLPAAVPAAGY